MIETGTIPERLWPDAMSLLFAQEASDSKAGLIQSGIERLRNEVDAREGLVGLWADDQVLLAAWLLRSDAESAMFG